MKNQDTQLIKNSRQLIDLEAEVIRDLRNGTMAPNIAHEITNAAGKMINQCKVDLEYLSIPNRDFVIPFLECD